MSIAPSRLPTQAWVVTFAGTAINLCLGILYAWNVWKNRLIASSPHQPGDAMTGIDAGWTYLTNAEATWAYSVCGVVFALSMIAGGRLQDSMGPKIGATGGGLVLAAGCILAGLLKSYAGLIVGFGILGGVGMGLAYAATTPAAVKWFGPHQRGLVVGLVVGGYGGAAIYISPLARYLIAEYGISGSFIGLGVFFAAVCIVAGQLLAWPERDYVPPAPPKPMPQLAAADWPAARMLGTWQFYALVFLFFGSAQSGLLVIANATDILKATATREFFDAYGWVLSSFGGLVNALGRVGTGMYSDRIGRSNAYLANAVVAALCVMTTPWIVESGSVALLFVVMGIAYWQYGGGLALLPAFTADFFGARNLGFNYGLVFLGWGIAFFLPLAAGYINDQRGSLDDAFYISGGLLLAAVAVCVMTRRPTAT
jgi:OFA family oxalate/formate antiporter-like MFS transporter